MIWRLQQTMVLVNFPAIPRAAVIVLLSLDKSSLEIKLCNTEFPACAQATQWPTDSHPCWLKKVRSKAARAKR